MHRADPSVAEPKPVGCPASCQPARSEMPALSEMPPPDRPNMWPYVGCPRSACVICNRKCVTPVGTKTYIHTQTLRQQFSGTSRDAWRCVKPSERSSQCAPPTLRPGDPVPKGLCTLGLSTQEALYTGDLVREGLCTLGPAATVQTPFGTIPPVRKVPTVASGHRTSPLAHTVL